MDILIERYRAPPIPHVSHAFTCSQTEVGTSVARSLDLLPRNPRRHTHALARFQWLPHARQFVCTRAITCRMSLPARARMHLLSRGLSHRSPSKVHEQVRSRAWEQREYVRQVCRGRGDARWRQTGARGRDQSRSLARVRVMTRHEQIERLLQERLWTARVGWRGAAMPATLLSLAQVPGWWVRVALDGLHHAFSCPHVIAKRPHAML